MTILRNVVLVVLVLLTGSGCGGLNSLGVKNQADMLSVLMNRYAADFRWGRYTDAYKYHVNQAGQQPDVDLAYLENFSVTDFRIINPSMNETATMANVSVEIDYVNNQYGTVNTLKHTQLWWFSADYNRWFIESEFPVLN